MRCWFLALFFCVGISFLFQGIPALAQKEPPGKEGGGLAPDGLKALKHPDPQIRYNAVEILGKLGKTAKFAVPHLVEMLKDPSISVRIKTAESLWNIDKYDPKKLLPVLLAAMESKEDNVKIATLSVLAQMGESAKSALPAVRKALKDKSFSVQLQAVMTAAAFGPSAKDAIPEMLELIRQDDIGFLEAPVTVALAKIGSRGVPVLIPTLADKNPKVRRSAAFALGLIGPKAYEAVPELTKALSDKEDSVRSFAATALGKIGSESESAIPELKKTLKDSAASVQVSSALALWQISKDKTGFEILSHGLAKNDDSSVRKNAASALGVIGPDAKFAASVLDQALKDNQEDVRQESVAALGKIGPSAEKYLPNVASLLEDKSVPVRLRAALSCWQIGKKVNDKMLKVLTEGLQEDAAEDRTFAAHVLGEIGPGAKSAIPTLMMLLKDRDPGVRQASANALKKIDPKSSVQKGIP